MSGPFDWAQEDKAMAKELEEKEATLPLPLDQIPGQVTIDELLSEYVCPVCGGELAWVVEITPSHPWGTGYDIKLCNDCEYEADRHFVGA